MHMTADSGPLLLHKNRQDVHEISNDSDVLGLFIDILSPPYDRRLRDNWPRQQSDRYVTYYREAGVASPEVMKEVVSSTSEFWQSFWGASKSGIPVFWQRTIRNGGGRVTTRTPESGSSFDEILFSDLGKKYFILEEIPCPSYYTTDQIPYQGESLRWCWSSDQLSRLTCSWLTQAWCQKARRLFFILRRYISLR
jgi:hypothetical protein